MGTSLPVNFKLQKSGYGAGTKDFVTHPNVLRVMFGSSAVDVKKESYSKKCSSCWRQILMTCHLKF